MRERKDGARLEQAFLGERTLPFTAYSGAWIPVLGQLVAHLLCDLAQVT